MRVPIYDGPQVSQAPAPAGYLNAGDYTVGSQALGQAANQIGDIADRMVARQAETDANNAQVQLQGAYLDWHQQQLQTRQGENANGLIDDAKAWWADQQGKLETGLSPMAKELVGRQLGQMRLQSLQSLGQYQDQQLEAAADASFVAAKQSIKSSAVANPMVFHVGRLDDGTPVAKTGVDLGVEDLEQKNAQYVARKGFGPDVLAKMNLDDTTELHTQVMQGLAQDSPETIGAYFAKYRGQINGEHLAEAGVQVAGAQQKLAVAATDAMLVSNPGALLDGLNRYFGLPPRSTPGAAAGAQPRLPAAASADAPRGVRLNNPGNLKAGADTWDGSTGSDGTFVQFVTPAAGLRAMTRNLMTYGDHGIDTLADVVSRWAPSSENDTSTYLAAVSKASGLAPDAKIDLHDPATLAKVVPAIIQQENGQQPYTPDEIRTGINAATGKTSLAELAPPIALSVPDAASALQRAGKPGDAGLPFLNALTPEHALEYRNRALEAVQRGQATQRAALQSQAQDFQSMVLAGVVPPAASTPNRDDYIVAYGDAGVQRYDADVGTYQRLAAGLQQLSGASWADRQAVIARYAPAPGPGFDQQSRVQTAMVQANQVIEKQIANDPAAFAVSSSPQVRGALQAVQSTVLDPMSTASADQRKAAVDSYVAMTTAEQQRLGVDRIGADALGAAGKSRQPGVRLLTNDQANSLAKMFASSPANAAQLMDRLQSEWGSAFPQVYGQLAQDDKLPPAAMVIPNMATPFSKETLARLSDPKTQKELIGDLPAGAKADIETKLQQANEPFFNTLANQGGGVQTFNVVKEQQTALASFYVMQGRSPSDAARMAFDETVGHAYQFADTMRIPKAEQPAMVLRGTAAVAAKPDALQSAPPASFRSGLAEKDRAAAWIDALRSGATWVTNGDETGATLYVRGRSDAGAPALYAVRDRAGAPMTWTWSRLRAIGAAQPAPTTPTNFVAPVPAGAPYARGEAFVQKLSDADRAAGLE